MINKTLYGISLLMIAFSVTAQESTLTCGDPLIDSRDNQSYKTIQIGNQCWMAENLNAGTIVSNFNQTNNGIIEKSCYNNDPALCEIYGGLYTWHEAVQGICPEGWHLPSNQEWSELNEYLGVAESGTHMKSTPDDDPAWDGDDSSGFSAIPSGTGHGDHFGRLGHWAIYWSSTEVDKDYAWFAQLDNYWYLDKYPILYQGNYYLKSNGFSVRCVKSEK